MIWLTWRQLRTQAAVLYGAVALIVAALAVTGPGLAQQYRTSGSKFLTSISGTDSDLYLLTCLVILAAPFVIGIFWGAPLVTRELDAGTHRLAWTLTTRTNWLVTKLGITGLAAMTATGLLSIAVTWWAEPIDQAVAARDGVPGPGFLIFPRLSPELFDERGIAPLGYAAFAFVLGVTIGMIVRRTLPAMALTVPVLAVTQVAFSLWARPRLVAAEHLTTTVTAANFLNIDMFNSMTVTVGQPGAWSLSQQTVNAAGHHPVSPPTWFYDCLGARNQAPCFTRLTALGYRQLVTLQPASNFWPLQWRETAIYLVLALLLAFVITTGGISPSRLTTHDRAGRTGPTGTSAGGRRGRHPARLP
jgi:hypothetical protein